MLSNKNYKMYMYAWCLKAVLDVMTSALPERAERV